MPDINLGIWLPVPHWPWNVGTLILGNCKVTVVGSQSHGDSLLTNSLWGGSKPASDRLPELISIQIAAAWGGGFVKEKEVTTCPHNTNVFAHKLLVWSSNKRSQQQQWADPHYAIASCILYELMYVHLWADWLTLSSSMELSITFGPYGAYLCAVLKLRARNCLTAGWYVSPHLLPPPVSSRLPGSTPTPPVCGLFLPFTFLPLLLRAPLSPGEQTEWYKVSR